MVHQIKYIILLFIGVIVLCCCQNNKEAESDFDRDKAYTLQNIKYGPYELNKLDLYLSAGRDASTPVLVLIHGGAWVHGDKSEFYSDYAAAFLRKGWCVANVNYRLLSDSVNCENIITDINAAIGHISEHASEYGIGNRFTLVGYSAGGHLALLYAYTNNSYRINSVISFAGPTNVNDPKFKQLVDSGWNSSYLYPLLLGEQFSQDSKSAVGCSPVYHVKNIPTLLIHGTNDSIVPFYQAEQLVDSLTKKKVKHQLLPIEGEGHDVYYKHRDVIDAAIQKWIVENN
jgi:acetyl esterase/lipase